MTDTEKRTEEKTIDEVRQHILDCDSLYARKHWVDIWINKIISVTKKACKREVFNLEDGLLDIEQCEEIEAAIDSAEVTG